MFQDMCLGWLWLCKGSFDMANYIKWKSRGGRQCLNTEKESGCSSGARVTAGAGNEAEGGSPGWYI